jgi:multiple sugar transport system substrate-binding protein
MVTRQRKAVSRREFLKLGGAGLAGAALLGAAGCGGSQSSGSVVRYFTGTAETTSQERANIEI